MMQHRVRVETSELCSFYFHTRTHRLAHADCLALSLCFNNCIALLAASELCLLWSSKSFVLEPLLQPELCASCGSILPSCGTLEHFQLRCAEEIKAVIILCDYPAASCSSRTLKFKMYDD